jgi:diguanylate cyclase (GGDEF)-like protein/PAS domain S-box-containing protein
MSDAIKILYLESNLALAEQVSSCLQSKGYQVHALNNGDDCLELLKYGDIDIFIVANAGVGFSGVQVLKQVRDLKVKPLSIMVSDINDTDLVIQVMQSGCVDFVLKTDSEFLTLLLASIDRVTTKQGLSSHSMETERHLLDNRKNLQRAQQLAKIGSWEYYPADDNAYWSQQEYRNFGYEDDDFKPTFERFIRQVHPDDREKVEANARISLQERVPKEFSYRLLLANEQVRYILSNTEVDVDKNGQVVRIFGVSQDITERIEAEKKLQQAATVYEMTSEAIFITDAKIKIISINPAFTFITGFSEQETIGQTPALLKSGRHDEKFYLEMRHGLEDKGVWHGEMWNRKKNGQIFPVWQSITAISDENQNVVQYVSVFSDITKHKESEELIRFQANYDGLTELPNRNLFLDRLALAVLRAKRSRTKVGLMMLDLDRFKWVNDTLGHRAGDIVLQETARRLKSAVRESDTVARLGGDEFSILLPELVKNTDIEVIAKKIFAAFKTPIEVEGREVHISGSIGITIAPDDGEDVETLQKNADSAMYSAKEDGRNCYHYFTAALQLEAERRLHLIDLLRQAIDNQELAIYYQPVIDIYKDEVVSAEALLRWKHPTLGFIPPAEFIPLAEESGLIRPIGNWVAEKVAENMVRWQSLGLKPVQISVNKSTAEFTTVQENADWCAIFARHDINPNRITVEITESVFMDDGHNYLQLLHQLHEQGMQISLDDFGTGYSSLSYLKRFPVDILKIDRSFIRDITDDPNDSLLVETIITLAEKLDIKVVAEGVETKEQLDFLKTQQCRYIQGYYFSKPLSLNQFEHFLSSDELKKEKLNYL